MQLRHLIMLPLTTHSTIMRRALMTTLSSTTALVHLTTLSISMELPRTMHLTIQRNTTIPTRARIVRKKITTTKRARRITIKLTRETSWETSRTWREISRTSQRRSNLTWRSWRKKSRSWSRRSSNCKRPWKSKVLMLMMIMRTTTRVKLMHQLKNLILHPMILTPQLLQQTQVK